MPWVPLEDPPEGYEAPWARDPGGKGRFLIDESLGIEVAEVIRGVGWKAVFVGEVGLRGHSDEDVFAYASRHDMVLLTHDRVFWTTEDFPLTAESLVIVPLGCDHQPSGCPGTGA